MLVKFYVLCLFLLSLGQLTNILKNSGVNLYLFDIAVVLFSLYGILYLLAVKRTFKVMTWHLIGSLFILWSLINLIFSLNYYGTAEFANGLLYLIRFVAYFSSSIVMVNMLELKITNTEKIHSYIILSGVLVAVIGFVQMIILPDFTKLDPSLGWDPHKNRLASVFFDPNFTGAYLVMIMALLIEKVYLEGKYTLFNIISFLTVLTAVFLTFSRSAWGMLSLVILVYGLTRFRKFLILFLIIAFASYFAIPRVQTRIAGITDPADSAHFRLISWSNTIKIINDHKLFGVGFNTYRYAQREYGFLTLSDFYNNSGAGSDSSFLFVAATTGIIGLLLYLVLFLYPAIKGAINDNKYKILLLSITVGLLMESQFINSLFYPQIMFIWFSLVVSCLYYI